MIYTSSITGKHAEMNGETITEQMSRPDANCEKIFSSEFPCKCTPDSPENVLNASK